MLNAVAELPQHLVGHIERVLGDEVDADTLGADQPHNLLDLVEQRFGGIGEQKMRFVEEEHELGLVGSPTSGSSSNNCDSSQSRKVA